MARTRPELARSEKREQVIELATRQLVERGYSGLSVAAVARELGIAQNTVYWYFPSKDDLLRACLNKLVADATRAKPPRSESLEHRLVWFADRFEELWRLGPAIRSRAQHAPAIAEFLDEMDALADRMLENALRNRVSQENLGMTVLVFRVLIEGTYVKDLPAEKRRDVLRLALSRFTSAPAP